MKRRQVLALTCALLAPAHVFAQQQRLPIVGVLVTHPPLNDPLFDVTRAAFRKLGYEDGKNIQIEIRSSLGQLRRVPALAHELVQLRPAAIVVVNEVAVRAVQQATRTVPIVMVGYVANDPVALKLIESYARPGGNVTGIFSVDSALLAKRLELLRETLPSISKVAVFWDSNFGYHQSDELKRAAQSLRLQLYPIDIRSPQDFDSGFRAAKREGAEALLLAFSPVYFVHRARLAQLALEAGLPSVYEFNQYVEAGGLMSYGSFVPHTWERAAYYVDRLLKGAKAAELPVEQVSTFKLTLNLKTAKALGLKIPESILIRADEVIR